MSSMNVAAGIAPMGARRSFDTHGLEPWLQQQGASATSSPISDALRGTPAPMSAGGQPWWQGLQDAQDAKNAAATAARQQAAAQAAAAKAAVPAPDPYASSGSGDQNYGW